MKIGIDARVLIGGKNTGVEEYTRRFLMTLFTQHPQHHYSVFINAFHGKVDTAWMEEFPHVKVKRFHWPNKLLHFCMWWLQYPHIDKLLGGVDVFFMPNINIIALSRACKLIVTLHDLSFVHYPQMFSWRRRMWHWFVNPRKLLARADHIIAVSEATKQDACFSYGLHPRDISVAYNGITGVRGTLTRNDAQTLAIKEKYHLPYKCILAFSTVEPRKNIVNLIRAFELFRARANGSGYMLIIAGARGWKDDTITRAIKDSAYAKDIIRIADVPEQEKEALYLLAELFVYPSYYEGFGFPPVEALMTKTPVLTSHTSALAEIVGAHAILIDPHRPEEIAYAMEEILTQRDLTTKDPEAFSTQSKKYSWTQSAIVFERESAKLL